MEKICENRSSIGYYIENTLGIELKDIWDYDKNIYNPDEVLKGTRLKTIWVKCMHHDYHGSYEITPFKFSCNPSSKTRCCPYCSKNEALKKVHVMDSFAFKFQNYLAWWDKDNEKTPFDYKGNELDVIKFTCPICGWSFESSIKEVNEKSFIHLCEKDRNLKREGVIKYEDKKRKKRREHFQNKLDEIHGKGVWTIKEFEATNKPGILIHECGAERHLSVMRIAYSSMKCKECEYK